VIPVDFASVDPYGPRAMIQTARNTFAFYWFSWYIPAA
jgi:hypothetical protein